MYTQQHKQGDVRDGAAAQPALHSANERNIMCSVVGRRHSSTSKPHSVAAGQLCPPSPLLPTLHPTISQTHQTLLLQSGAAARHRTWYFCTRSARFSSNWLRSMASRSAFFWALIREESRRRHTYIHTQLRCQQQRRRQLSLASLLLPSHMLPYSFLREQSILPVRRLRLQHRAPPHPTSPASIEALAVDLPASQLINGPGGSNGVAKVDKAKALGLALVVLRSTSTSNKGGV